MDTPAADYEIHVFIEEEDGSIADFRDYRLSEFGGAAPSVGDELPLVAALPPDGGKTKFYFFLVVKRRIFFPERNRIVLICDSRATTDEDRFLFEPEWY